MHWGLMMRQVCDKQNCTGCFACANACPKDAIKMVVGDDLGHVYPIIDQTLCVDCGICQNTCPANKDVILNKPKTVYAGYSFNEEEYKTSTSGGFASYFSRRVIDANGVVYGCSSVLQDGAVVHKRCTQKEDLEDLKGSKYVQSFIQNSFSLCKKDLIDGKQVLFIATPCQISGLKNYLVKDYSNLITIDLVCHGVPSQQILFEHLKDLKVSNAVRIGFREDCKMQLKVQTADGECVKSPQYKDNYYIAFLSNIMFRESCLQCKYATQNRVADITLGDFWGLGKKTPFNHQTPYGVSLCMVNTDKGEAFFNSIKDGMFLEERTLDEAVAGNLNLRKPSARNPKRESFIKTYTKKGFKKAVKSSLKKEIFKSKLIHFINSNKLLKKILKAIKG